MSTRAATSSRFLLAIRVARPHHWIKNGLVFVPVLFGRRVWDVQAWRQTGLAAAAFCLAASAVYFFNDVLDSKSDRTHPWKRHRPVASGQLSVSAALAASGLLVLAAAIVAACANTMVLYAVLGYAVLNVVYCLLLRHKMIVDVMCIAFGFVLRAVGGAVAIPVEISPWLLVCTFCLCMFIGFCKRRNEVAALGGTAQSSAHRTTLARYTPELLTHLITLSAGIAVVTFLLYSTSPRTIEHVGTEYLLYTTPIVLYAICRCAMMSIAGTYADPVALVLHDRPMQACILGWLVAATAVVMWGRQIEAWVQAAF